MAARGYDFIVTGAGSAGCVIAARLSEDTSANVLLLEAGERDRSRLFRIPAGFAKMTKGIASWGWSTTPQRHMKDRVFWYTQARVLGGGSTINAQVYTRGAPEIYDSWADEHGCDGWDYANCLGYFRKAEDNQRFVGKYHAQGGPLGVSTPIAPLPITEAFIRACQQYGIPYNPDFNASDPRGCGYYQVTQRHAERSSTSKAYLKPAEARPNLTVMTNAMATGIITANGRATGVRYIENGLEKTAHAGREVIVTSGAIGSPRLLLLSGIGPAGHLKEIGAKVAHDLPGVGENLHDHLDLFAIAECVGRHTYDHYAKPHWALVAGLQYALFKNGPAASSLFETGAFWHSGDDARSADLQFHFGQGSGIEAGVASMPDGGVTLNGAYVQPKSRGTVRLQSTDPAAEPRIDPNYWAVDDDRRRAIEGLKITRDILRQDALAPYLKAERLPGPDVTTDQELFDYACANAKTQHHPAGACKMGPASDPLAVVDSQLRVHGLAGLRVCDSSIMPQVSASNTNAAAIMIGEKAADLIKGNRI